MVSTASSQHFLQRSEQYDAAAWAAWSALTPPVQVLSDQDEWSAWDRVGDAVVHIQVTVRRSRCSRFGYVVNLSQIGMCL